MTMVGTKQMPWWYVDSWDSPQVSQAHLIKNIAHSLFKFCAQLDLAEGPAMASIIITSQQELGISIVLALKTAFSLAQGIMMSPHCAIAMNMQE